MSDHQKIRVNTSSSLAGTLWVIGWIFTIGFAKLIWWQGILGVIIWPYYLGVIFSGRAI